MNKTSEILFCNTYVPILIVISATIYQSHIHQIWSSLFWQYCTQNMLLVHTKRAHYDDLAQ